MQHGAFVLAGGRSSRMGRDKALLPWAGTTLLEWQINRLQSLTSSVCVIAPQERYQHLSVPVLPDRLVSEGPLAGLCTALAHTACDWNLILAVDLPLVPVAFLARLLASGTRSTAHLVLPLPDGAAQPLCAAYHRQALPVLEAAFRAGVRRVRDAIAPLPAVVLPECPPDWFRNGNTPGDWTALAQWAERAGQGSQA